MSDADFKDPPYWPLGGLFPYCGRPLPGPQSLPAATSFSVCPNCKSIFEVKKQGQAVSFSSESFEALTKHIHAKLMDKLDFSGVSDVKSDQLRREIRLVVERLVDVENPLLNRHDRERVIEDVIKKLKT